MDKIHKATPKPTLQFYKVTVACQPYKFTPEVSKVTPQMNDLQPNRIFKTIPRTVIQKHFYSKILKIKRET